MNKLLTIYKETVVESLNRRGEMAFYILEDLIGPLLSILLWVGVINYAGSVQSGWDVNRIVSYFLVTTVLTLAVNHYVDTLVGYEHIYQGELANLLVKPMLYQLYALSTETGWKTVIRRSKRSFGRWNGNRYISSDILAVFAKALQQHQQLKYNEQ